MKITRHKTFNNSIKYVRCKNKVVAMRLSDHEFFNTEL